MTTTKKIKSFEDAAKILGMDPKSLPGVEGLPEKHASAVVSNYKLWIISEAFWKGTKLDWTNSSQYKYFPWFWMNDTPFSSGSGFSFSVYDSDDSRTRVGSRLCFPTREIAEYVGKTFIDLYRDVMVIQGS